MNLCNSRRLALTNQWLICLLVNPVLASIRAFLKDELDAFGCKSKQSTQREAAFNIEAARYLFSLAGKRVMGMVSQPLLEKRSGLLRMSSTPLATWPGAAGQRLIH